MSLTKHLIVLCGPTGIGKSSVAINLAKDLKCDIISADSRQLFNEMSIGTAVPSKKELLTIPHHFIRSHSIHQYYNASIFEVEVLYFLDKYYKKNNTIIMVGGSGLYINAVCKGIDDLPTIDQKIREKWAIYFKEKGIDFLRQKVQEIDPEYLSETDQNNPKRLLKAIEVYEMTGKPYSSFLRYETKSRPFNIVKIGLNTQRERLYEQINQRVERMISDGLIEEAKTLIRYRHLTPLNTVGYKELFAFFDGEMTLEAAIEKIKDHTRAYARRQLTWFHRDKEIHWFEPENMPAIKSYIETSINQ
jgi:tRNA dimethylallyltransferase